MIEHEIMQDLSNHGGSKRALIEYYGKRMNDIRVLHGGSVGDIPVDPDHEYNVTQRKLHYLNRLNIPEPTVESEKEIEAPVEEPKVEIPEGYELLPTGELKLKENDVVSTDGKDRDDKPTA